MRLSRARYVTVCQQSLVTAVVVVVAVSAAGVRTLDIVPSPSPGATAATPQRAVAAPEAVVATEPTEPEVREVAVEEVTPRGRASRTPSPSASPSASTGPGRSAGSRSAAPEPVATPTIDGRRVVAQSKPARVEGFATVGVTWDDAATRAAYDADEIAVQVRTKKDGAWTGWAPVEYHDEHGPDASEAARAQERAGTEPVVVGDVDQVQVRAATADGSAPADLELAVVDPGESGTAIEQPDLEPGPEAGSSASSGSAATAEPAPASSADDTAVLNAARSVAKPTIYSRAQWGADESLRDGRPSYGTVKTGFIHHTVNANTYSEASVPSLIRGIYAYHTVARGWSDIGYNFLVDRFGRIWEGRAGGIDRAVVGAHTSGYNSSSFAMSAIGNFDIAAPPQAVVDAYSRLFAWKLSLAGVKANATGIRLGSRTFQGINGHRDAGSTACPGRFLYAKLPSIRTAATKLQNGSSTPVTPTPTPKPTPTPTPAPGDVAPTQRLTSPVQRPATWAKQRAGLTMPRARNLVGQASPELVLKRPDGSVDLMTVGSSQTGFGPAVTSPGDWSRSDLVAAAGDLDRDGRGDVISRDRGGPATFHRGAGDGRVAAAGTALRPTFAGALSLASAGDWNGDGRPDLLVRNANRQLVVWHGQGGPAFTRGPVLAQTWGHANAFVAGDLDGDGRPEVVGTTRGRVDVYATSTRSLLGRISTQTPPGSTAAAAAPGAAADLSGDGTADVLTYSAGGIRIVPGARTAALDAPIGPVSGPSSLRMVSLGQMVGTAHGDLVGISGSRLLVSQHNGSAPLSAPSPTGLTLPRASQLLSVGDWDGDGHGDLVTREDNGTHVGGRLVLRLGNGRGGFGTPTTMSNGWRPVRELSAVGDVTGDGAPDLAGVLPSGQTVVYPGAGKDGTYAPVTAPATLTTFTTVGVGTWRTEEKPRRLPSRDGSFVPAGSNAAVPSGHDQVVGPGDVDGDGRPDLVTAERSTGRLFLVRGTSGGMATPLYLGRAFPGYLVGG